MLTRKMKDSGVEWIGEIPEDWEVVKLGIVADISTGNTPKDPDNIKYSKSEGVDWLKTNNLLGVDGVSNSSLKIKEQYISEARLTNPGSVLVTCIGDIGKLGYTSKPMAFNQQINAITFTKDIVYWKYGMYALYSQREQQESFANGNVLKILNRENQKKVVITVPKDINKQIKISNALDKICLYIRKLVDKTQQSIEELKKYKQSLITEAVTKGLDPNVEMKDSGIEWVGEIPIQWKNLRFGRIISINSELVNPSNYRELPQVSPDDIEQNGGKLFKFKTVKQSGVSSNNYYFFKNQILYSKIRPKLNKVAIAPFDGLCSADMYPIETSENVNFITYLMMSHSFLHQVSYLTADRVKMPKINRKELSSILIVLPSIEEQRQIVSYLDEQTSRIDKLIADKTKVIEELEDYKKSLIYEYVTGKKEV